MPKRHKLLVLIMTEALMAAIGAMVGTTARVMFSTDSVQAHRTDPLVAGRSPGPAGSA